MSGGSKLKCLTTILVVDSVAESARKWRKNASFCICVLQRFESAVEDLVAAELLVELWRLPEAAAAKGGKHTASATIN